MTLTSLRNHLGPAVFLGILLSVPLSSAACGRTACFSWSKGEGACPAQKDALRFFTSRDCPGNVVSVDSEGTPDFDGRLCCYDVTQNEVHFDTADGTTCVPSGSSSSGISPSGAGGANTSSGFVSSTSFVSSTASGPPPCVTCSQAITDPSAPVDMFCPGSEALLAALQDCVCSGACASSCSDNVCEGLSTSEACITCIQDSANGCGQAFLACSNDI